jgi:FkbM family methyltransferase
MNLHRLVPKPIRSLLNSVRRTPARLAGYRVMDTTKLFAYPEISHLRRFFAVYDVDCVFDVGANRGQYATMLRRQVGYRGRIISFEPDPATADMLRETAHGDAEWEVREVALADREGVQQFHVMRDSQFNSLSSPRHDETRMFADSNCIVAMIEVPTETLATALSKASAKGAFANPYLKMDTQGYDLTIVAHCPGILQTFVGIQTEMAVKKLYQDSAGFTELMDWYVAHGFDVSAIVPNNDNSGHFPVLVESDCIFIRRDLVPCTGDRGVS